MAHAGVNRLPSGCASALGSSAASPASAAAVKIGAGRLTDLTNSSLEGWKSLCNAFQLVACSQGNFGHSSMDNRLTFYCMTALVDCLTLTVQESHPVIVQNQY